MSITLSINETQTLTAVRAFLLNVCGAVPVIRGQQNRAAIPTGPNWLVITPLFRPRIATNIDTWSTTGTPTTMSVETMAQETVQCDCYGPLAQDNATIIQALWRDEYGVLQLATSGFDITPLYTSEPRNLTFINDQDQYEYRWSVDLHMQVNPILTVPQQFAAQLRMTAIISVDEKWPA